MYKYIYYTSAIYIYIRYCLFYIDVYIPNFSLLVLLLSLIPLLQPPSPPASDASGRQQRRQRASDASSASGPACCDACDRLRPLATGGVAVARGDAGDRWRSLLLAGVATLVATQFATPPPCFSPLYSDKFGY